ncbi:phosphoribosyl-ATP pyrophosphatase [Sulfolobus acidocaldarius SUSAZ]|nr:phosphoribosyl-ATP pyrophosphatase [Sulfolobus acidocaldarius SUSAZ]
MSDDVIDKLYSIILDRMKTMKEGSYTVELIKRGKHYVAQKVGEESTEAIIASLVESQQRFVEEVSDLIYHLLVLMALENVTPQDVYKELERRMKK